MRWRRPGWRWATPRGPPRGHRQASTRHRQHPPPPCLREGGATSGGLTDWLTDGEGCVRGAGCLWHGVVVVMQKAEAKAREEGEEVSAKLEATLADKKQLEEDAFQVTKVSQTPHTSFRPPPWGPCGLMMAGLGCVWRAAGLPGGGEGGGRQVAAARGNDPAAPIARQGHRHHQEGTDEPASQPSLPPIDSHHSLG